MPKKPNDHRSEKEDLWRGSRLVIIVMVALLAAVIAAVLRAGESASRSVEGSEASVSALVAPHDLADDGRERQLPVIGTDGARTGGCRPRSIPVLKRHTITTSSHARMCASWNAFAAWSVSPSR